MSRRKFLKTSALGVGGILLAKCASGTDENNSEKKELTKSPLRGDAEGRGAINKPIVVSTWNHGLAAHVAAWEILNSNVNALDAVENGVKVTESVATHRSVGLGVLPDRVVHLTLDACIMNHGTEGGSLAFFTDIEHPISVARKVMEETPHVLIVGEGAYEFAIAQGFPKKDLLTPEAKEEWLKWKKTQEQKKPAINSENHDTIGMLAIDEAGNISGACTTSGWAYKLHGRVGDSPIIGAGLFVDNEVGGACATGMGEAVIRIAGSHTVVELMRQGKSPQEACKEAVERIIKKHKNLEGLQVGFLAMNKNGEVGAHSVYAGFNYALKDKENNQMVDAGYEMEW